MALLHDADRRLDSQFQVIDNSTYTPRIYQGTTLVTTSERYVEGFRIGTWVQLNVYARASSAGAAGGIVITLPPQLPIIPSSTYFRTVGDFMFIDSSASGLPITGDAIPLHSVADFGGSAVMGQRDNVATTSGPIGTSPLVTVATSDVVTACVQYLTTLASL
jgi:hypothetical protein